MNDDFAVLIVDDDPGLRRMLEMAFEMFSGVRIYTAKNAPEGIIVFREHPEIGIVVCDRQMGGPGLDGEDLHAAIADGLKERQAYFVLLHGSDGRNMGYFTQAGVVIATKPLPDICTFVQEVLSAVRKLRAA